MNHFHDSESEMEVLKLFFRLPLLPVTEVEDYFVTDIMAIKPHLPNSRTHEQPNNFVDY